MAQLDVDINFNLNNVDELETAAEQLQGLGDKAEESKQPIEDMGNSADDSGDKVKNMGEKSEESSESIDLLTDAVSGLIALGLAAEFNNTAMAADKFNVSMAALEQVSKNNNISLGQTTAAIKQVTDATSISGSQARSYFSMLMNLGVTNTDALAQSMINLKGQSAITGGTIEQMSSKFTTLINSSGLSARSLTNLGLSLQDLAATNGMSVDEMKAKWSTMTADQKVEALNKAMAKNKSLVTTMNKTTGEQLQEVKNSWGELEATVGQSTTKANQYVYGLANGAIKDLTWAVKNIPFGDMMIGGGLAFGSLAGAAQPALDTFNTVYKSVKNAHDAIGKFSDAIGTAKDMIDAMRDAETLAEGVSTALAIAKGEEAIAEGVDGAAKTLNLGPTVSLSIAEWSLSIPILLVAAAIIALIAVLVYLYYNNETVRKSVDKLIDIFKTIVKIIINSVITAFNRVKNIINNVKTTVTNLYNAIQNKLVGAWNSLKNAVNNVISPLKKAWDTLSGIINTAKNAPSNLLSWLPGFGSFDIGFSGFSSGTINDSIGSGSFSTINTTVNNNFNGIIEDDAKEWAVNAINERLTRENLIRGV